MLSSAMSNNTGEQKQKDDREIISTIYKNFLQFFFPERGELGLDLVRPSCFLVSRSAPPLWPSLFCLRSPLVDCDAFLRVCIVCDRLLPDSYTASARPCAAGPTTVSHSHCQELKFN